MTKHPPYPVTPFYDRLTELSKLKDGWLDGYGKAPTPPALTAASVLGPALPRDISLRVYPTEEGGVSLEWDDQHGGHEIEVLPDGHLFLMTVERIAEDEMAGLRARIAKARALHQPIAGEEGTQWCRVCAQEERQPQPIGWWVPFPCPTVQALEGTDA